MFNAPCFAQKALFGQMSTVDFQLRRGGGVAPHREAGSWLEGPEPTWGRWQIRRPEEQLCGSWTLCCVLRGQTKRAPESRW